MLNNEDFIAHPDNSFDGISEKWYKLSKNNTQEHISN